MMPESSCVFDDSGIFFKIRDVPHKLAFCPVFPWKRVRTWWPTTNRMTPYNYHYWWCLQMCVGLAAVIDVIGNTKFWNDHNQLGLEISLVKCHAYNIWTHVAHFNDLNIFEYLLAAVDLGPKSAATHDHQGMISMMNPRVAEQVFNPVLPKSRGAFRHVIWMK